MSAGAGAGDESIVADRFPWKERCSLECNRTKQSEQERRRQRSRTAFDVRESSNTICKASMQRQVSFTAGRVARSDGDFTMPGEPAILRGIRVRCMRPDATESTMHARCMWINMRRCTFTTLWCCAVSCPVVVKSSKPLRSLRLNRHPHVQAWAAAPPRRLLRPLPRRVTRGGRSAMSTCNFCGNAGTIVRRSRKRSAKTRHLRWTSAHSKGD